MDDFSLPGFEVEELLGFGGCGEVWRARESSTGDLVALKRVPAGSASAISADQLAHEAALLAAVRHDHIVALRSVVATVDGLVLVLDYAEGGSLAALLAVRGRLSAGEVVTIGAPLAQALADMHAQGLMHGDVTPGNIVFDGSGKPLLADLGVAHLVGDDAALAGRTPGFADPALSQPGLASDVHGLAAVCFSALAGVPPYSGAEPLVAQSLGALAPSVPAALAAAIQAALDPDPAARPDAAAFARAVFASCPPVAVRLARGSPLGGGTAAAVTHNVPGQAAAAAAAVDVESPSVSRFRPSTGRHRWSAGREVLVRRLVAVTCVVAMLGAAVVVGVTWGWADHGHGASASSPSAAIAPASAAVTPPADSPAAQSPAAQSPAAPSPFATAPDWQAVVAALDRSRDSAFADADADELAAIYVPGSAALATDRATLGRLVGAGQRVRGLQFALKSVRVVSQSTGEVTLTVADTLAGYDVVDTGGVATPVAGRGLRNWTVVLRSAAGDWRIASIAPA